MITPSWPNPIEWEEQLDPDPDRNFSLSACVPDLGFTALGYPCFRPHFLDFLADRAKAYNMSDALSVKKGEAKVPGAKRQSTS
jgi:hypothetical protein